MFQTEHEREVYEGRLKQQRDERARLQTSEFKGRQAGILEGMAKAIPLVLEGRFGESSQRIANRLAEI